MNDNYDTEAHTARSDMTIFRRFLRYFPSLWREAAELRGKLWTIVLKLIGRRESPPYARDEGQDSEALVERDFVRAIQQGRERDAERLRVQAAESALREARARQAEAEENERKGIRPIVWPTPAEVDATKARLHYSEGLVHIAISGIAGSGKSSLANALRGLRNSDNGAAPTGVTADESTVEEFARFPDSTRPCVWYDIPGAGTLAVPDWKYFTDQGLYIFHCIIVLIDARITELDIAILRNAARFKIPTYIVRSKASQNIRNIVADTPANDSGDSESESAGTTITPLRLERARDTYIRETRANIEENLEAAGLPRQRVYLVDKDILVRAVRGKAVKASIDEVSLHQDLAAEINRHRALREV